MPAVQPSVLTSALIDAIHDSGCSVVLVSPLRQHPRRFIVSNPDGTSLSLWIYAWTLTPGGRPSLPHEYRIQMTSVKSPLRLNAGGSTVLIGFEPNLKVFAGFDLERHGAFTPGSPSVQIDIRTIQQALQDGLAFDRKANNEIAVGVRPDQFVAYVYNASDLHRYGRQATTFGLLERASSLKRIREDEIAPLTAKRRRIVQTISRLSRAGNFRQQVMQAYAYRCAITRMQLKLVEAAHIVPVDAPGSSDDVRNGIALSPTYHRAYDNGLIYLDENHVMQINPAIESDLAKLKLDHGLDDFKAPLGRIFLPPDRRQWPGKQFIERANRLRQIK